MLSMVPELAVRLAAADIVEVLDARTAGAMQQRWRETYARQLQATRGKWCLGNYDWGVLSEGFAINVAEGAAEKAWTMAFTHEIGWLGPYFARAEWQPAEPTTGRRRRH